MGDWSDYFEDFPEENPANYVGNKFDPRGAQTVREQQAKSVEENAEVRKLLAEAWKAEKEKSLFLVESCPQCGLETLNTYKVKGKYYLCECQDCGTYGKGNSHAEALEAIRQAWGESLDWRDGLTPWERLQT